MLSASQYLAYESSAFRELGTVRKSGGNTEEKAQLCVSGTFCSFGSLWSAIGALGSLLHGSSLSGDAPVGWELASSDI